MELNSDQIEERRNGMPEGLQELVEELATKLVLGDTDREQWAALLKGVCSAAETTGRADVSQIAADSLEALSNAADLSGIEAVCSRGVVGMQQALMEGAPEVPLPDVNLHSKVSPAPAAAPVSLGEDREIIGDFILESRDHLTQVEIQMMTLEKVPGDGEAINTVFRAFHTIKGLAGFMDLNDIREVAHETETLLDLARNQKLRITPAVVDIVLAAADFLKVWLERLETTLTGGDPAPAPEKQALLECIRRGALGEPTVEAGVAAQIEEQAGVDETSDTERRKELPVDWTGPERRRSQSDRRAAGTESRSVKVDTAKLDFLVDMAGEMVIAQSMVRHHPELAALRSPAVLRSLAQLARITGDLQKTAMSMRMVPVGRAISEDEPPGAGSGSQDRQASRNGSDRRGHRTRSQRGGRTGGPARCIWSATPPITVWSLPKSGSAAGKDPTGRIRLRASHQAGHIVIEIADDGRGLIREKILAKARRMGLVERWRQASPTAEVFNFIFPPGFSTAAEVTDVSGRGVGMDVVKEADPEAARARRHRVGAWQRNVVLPAVAFDTGHD